MSEIIPASLYVFWGFFAFLCICPIVCLAMKLLKK